MKNDNKQLRDTIRKNLIDLRTAHGLTQADVGQIVGRSTNAVGSWEQGLSMPDIITLYALSKYYNKSLEFMYGEAEK